MNDDDSDFQGWYEEWWLADQVLPGLADYEYDRLYDARLIDGGVRS